MEVYGCEGAWEEEFFGGFFWLEKLIYINIGMFGGVFG